MLIGVEIHAVILVLFIVADESPMQPCSYPLHDHLYDPAGAFNNIIN